LPKVIALGGINEDNIQLVKQAGFSGAAVLGAIWQADDPVTAFLNINAIVDQL
jgi:thiamine-phosphate pyrophosphorylase